MFSQKVQVRFSECDCNGQMTFQNVVRHFIDIGHFHDVSQGYNVVDREKQGFYWVILSWDLEVDRYPQMNEWLTVATYVHFQPQYFCVRFFEMKDEAGTVVARGTTNCCFCDTETNQAKKIPADVMEKFAGDDYASMPKLSLINTLEQHTFTLKRTFTVDRQYLDVNRHINNLSYLCFIMNELEPEDTVRKARIYYSFPGKEKEELAIYECSIDGTRVFRTANRETDQTKSVIQLWLN